MTFAQRTSVQNSYGIALSSSAFSPGISENLVVDVAGLTGVELNDRDWTPAAAAGTAFGCRGESCCLLRRGNLLPPAARGAAVSVVMMLNDDIEREMMGRDLMVRCIIQVQQ